MKNKRTYNLKSKKFELIEIINIYSIKRLKWKDIKCNEANLRKLGIQNKKVRIIIKLKSFIIRIRCIIIWFINLINLKWKLIIFIKNFK